MVRPKLVRPRGILELRPDAPITGYARFWPGDALMAFVEHYWTVRWDLAEPEVHEVLPHPSVHLAVERGSTRIVGIPSGRFTSRLEGEGRVLGVKFRPGGFRPWIRGPVSRLTGRTVLIDEVLGGNPAALEERALAEPDAVAAFEVIESWLVRRRPALDERAEWIAGIVERAAVDREITRVEHLASLALVSVRALQRLFAEYVGVSPKWVIQRYRLHEAAERIATGEAGDQADLALDLGYADQAHFIRDFRRWVGRTPADYARRLRGPAPDNRPPDG